MVKATFVRQLNATSYWNDGTNFHAVPAVASEARRVGRVVVEDRAIDRLADPRAAFLERATRRHD